MPQTGSIITINASADGDAFTIEETSTSGNAAGEYKWFAYVTRTSDSKRVTIVEGTIQVREDPGGASVDRRTHAEKALGAIEAVLENRASKDDLSYSIGDRQLSRIPVGDLLKLRDYYRAEVARERNRERMKRGRPTRRAIGTKFV